MGNTSKMTNIQKRKRLQALFERGDYVRFDATGVLPKEAEDTEDTIKIWVGPPSPLQREMAIREAQAARSRAMLQARNDSESSQYLNARSFISNLALEELVEYVMDLDDSARLTKARREVLLEPEWEDFNALRDAMRQFEEAGSPQDDPEFVDLLARDALFGDQVNEAFARLREADQESLMLQPRAELEKKALEKRVDQAGGIVFMKVYEDWMLYYGCRDDEDHTAQFFEDVDDLKSMPEQVQDALAARLADFVNEAAEAKNSPRAASGSTSSVPSDAPETSAPSGPEESNESTSVPGP